MNFPKTVKKTFDLLSGGAALPIHCRITPDGLLPALAPVKRAALTLSGIISAARSEGANRFFLCNDTYVYVSANGETFAILPVSPGETPFLVEEICDGVARAVVICGTNAVTHTGTVFKTVQVGVSLACGVMHCGRLFGIASEDRRKLCWSGEGGVSDWEEGLHGSGSLQLDPGRGDVLDIAEYGEKLVLVRKYGLTVVSAFGAPENFKVAITDTDTDAVYGGTARVVGGKLLFYTDSGLHAYDGNVISSVSHRCAGDVSAPTYALEFGGKYFLSCVSESLGGRAVLCYDPGDGESYLINCGADGMCSADRVYVYDSSESHGVYNLEEGGEYAFTSVLDFGTGRKKTVTEIYADCEGADIEISNGKISRSFSGASGIIRPRLRGKKFTVKVTANCRINKLTATAEASVGI